MVRGSMCFLCFKPFLNIYAFFPFYVSNIGILRVFSPMLSCQGPVSSVTAALVDSARQSVLDHFGVSPREWSVVFTSGATAALKMVGELFPWQPGATFAHARASHNSVLGIREYASKSGADVECVDLDGRWGLQEDRGGVLPTPTRANQCCPRACGAGSGSGGGKGVSPGAEDGVTGRMVGIGEENGGDGGDGGGGGGGGSHGSGGGDSGSASGSGGGGDGGGGNVLERSEDGGALVKQRGTVFGVHGGDDVGDAATPAGTGTGADADADTNTDRGPATADVSVDSSDVGGDKSDDEVVVDCLFAFPAECNATGARADLSIAGRVKRGALSTPPCTCLPRGAFRRFSQRRCGVAVTAAEGYSSSSSSGDGVESGRRASENADRSSGTAGLDGDVRSGGGPAASGGGRPLKALQPLQPPPPPSTGGGGGGGGGRRPRKRWWVMLDASKFVSTAPLDLSAVEADYVTLSFYKMFG